MVQTVLKKSLNGRFQILFASLIVLFLVTPFFNISFLTDVVITIIFFTALGSVAEDKNLLRIAFVLALVTVSLTWSSYAVDNYYIKVLSKLLDVVFVLLIIGVIFRKVIIAERITAEVVAAAVCVYLFIGLLWSDLYILLVMFEPNAFSNIFTESQDAASLSYASHMLSKQFIYFSFVTLSTLGYGDITPVIAQAKAMASMEAIIGQLYIAVLIARLVSQQTTSSKSDV